MIVDNDCTILQTFRRGDSKTNERATRDRMNYQQAEHEVYREQANRDELIERIGRAIHEEGTLEPLKGLHLHRSSSPTEPHHGVSVPALCVIAQGSKEVFMGEVRYRYGPLHSLLTTIELFITSQVIEASPEQPYLGLLLELDPPLVSSVIVEAGHFSPQNQTNVRAMNVSPLDASLLDAVVRLVRLLDSPAEARILAPLIMRELIYRLLMEEQGGRIHHIAILAGYTHTIVRAIDHLRKNFDQPLHIESIAGELGMSVSSFHHHFKAVTAMSPLQYQKRLRLQEARRLLLCEGLDAASVAFRVGYYDAAHFNRDHKRLFGLPPLRDGERVRESAQEAPSLLVD